jgi:nicotinamidase-related amidase
MKTKTNGTESKRKTSNPNELTIENSVLLLIDHQPAVAINVHSIDLGLLVNNVAALSQVAKALGIPTVLTTVGAEGSVLVDPIFKEITEAFPDNTVIDRPSSHAWSHPDVRAAVEATGRKKLVMAGLVTEVCLAQSVLAARKDGYEVYFVSDCSGGVTKEAHDDAKVRMTMAGAKPINWMALTGEWAPYWASPERAIVTAIDSKRGGTSSSVVSDWVMAQVTAGVVPAPSFISTPRAKQVSA